MPPTNTMASVDRWFWAHVQKTNGCWLWTAGTDRHGSGITRLEGRGVKAPRVSWEIAFGPIPAGTEVRHGCGVAACVRPEHLALGPSGQLLPLATRLALFVNKSGDCWEWVGRRTAQGYGETKVDGRFKLTHRAAWEQANGPIPDGMCVLHRCDNPPCCNPAHLFLGDRATNNADRDRKGRRGRGWSVRRLSDADLVAIREAHSNGITKTALAKLYGSQRQRISRLLKEGGR